jgi:hypothetical protein
MSDTGSTLYEIIYDGSSSGPVKYSEIQVVTAWHDLVKQNEEKNDRNDTFTVAFHLLTNPKYRYYNMPLFAKKWIQQLIISIESTFATVFPHIDSFIPVKMIKMIDIKTKKESVKIQEITKGDMLMDIHHHQIVIPPEKLKMCKTPHDYNNMYHIEYRKYTNTGQHFWKILYVYTHDYPQIAELTQKYFDLQMLPYLNVTTSSIDEPHKDTHIESAGEISSQTTDSLVYLHHPKT